MSNEVQTQMNGRRNLTERLGLPINAVLDQQILTAQAFPRDEKKCLENILRIATMDTDIADSCYYTLPRDGKNISGPSIRLAEICFSQWGNIRAGTEVKSNDGNVVIVRGWCEDLQNNSSTSNEVTKAIRYSASHKRYAGQTYSADMQATTIAAASAIALRNAIFKIVPQVFVEKAYKRCMESISEGMAFQTRLRTVFERMDAIGIGSKTILEFFNKNTIDQITPEELTVIIGTGTAIKEGTLKAEEAFASYDRSTGEILAVNAPQDKLDELLG